IERQKCLLLSHAGTLFSVFRVRVHVADLRPLGGYLVEAIQTELRAEGLPADTFSALDPDTLQLAKTASRSNPRLHDRNGVQIGSSGRIVSYCPTLAPCSRYSAYVSTSRISARLAAISSRPSRQSSAQRAFPPTRSQRSILIRSSSRRPRAAATLGFMTEMAFRSDRAAELSPTVPRWHLVLGIPRTCPRRGSPPAWRLSRRGHPDRAPRRGPSRRHVLSARS